MARTLLIVDDIKSNREILKNMLGSEYRIIEAEHGQEALARMTRDYAEISAVLLDLGMPVMDGYEVLAYMQGSELLSQLPVIVTTGQTDAGSEEKALRLGAKDYISKPYKSAIIRQRIWNTINLRETAAAVNTLQKDKLTGVWNRETFFQKAASLIDAEPAGYFILGCVDIDNFKVVNDQYGNEMGDAVLKSLANALQHSCENHGGICGRIFADCFISLYPRTFVDSGLVNVERLERAIDADTGMKLALSIGRYVVEDKTLSISAMYDRATIVQSTIKGRFDTHVAVYNESMRSHIVREQAIVNDMNIALTEKQFEVWYQPQYNHSTGALIGAEALVRWRHPKKGLISPTDFVPVFEQNGFIYALDQYVWETVCQYLRKEIDENRSPLPVSVNISRYDVFRPDFVSCITGLIDRYQIPVDLLRLEITESAFAESMDRIVSVVKELIAFGFTLEIDDFGSGYSSLNTLKNVPAQVVKLDMRFLEDDDGSQRGGSIIESIVRMTKWLGMSAIAEGVEKTAQADYLKSIGCNYVQGYLYAEPMQEDAYRTLCQNVGKEEKLLVLETVENLDNSAFWNPESMDTLIFNSYVGAACIYEYHQGTLELLRASDKYAQVIGSAGMTVEDALKLNWVEHLDAESREKLFSDLNQSVKTHKEVTGEYVFLDLPGCRHETYLRSTMRVIASAGNRYLVYCATENITAQRKAEQRERTLSAQMQAVMNNVACGITAVSIQGEVITYILSNDRYYELLGYTKEQYEREIGSAAYTTIHPEDRDWVAKTVNQVYDTGKSVTMEYRALRRDKTVIWMRSIVSRAAFEGIADRIQLSTYTDITEQKQAALTLASTTKQLRTMMNDIPGGFARLRIFPDGSITPVYFNDGYLKLVNMGNDERMRLYKDSIYDGVHPDDVPAVRKIIAQMLHSGEPCSLHYRLLTGSGEYIALRVFGRITKDASGDAYLNNYYADATEQLRKEEQQRELLDNLPYGVALYEYDGRALSVVHLNKRYWELVNRDEKAYPGQSFLNAVHADDREIISRELSAAIRDKREIICDVRVLYGENEYRPFHIVGHIQRQTDGRYSVYAVYTPISDEAMSVQAMLPIVLSAIMDSQTDYSFVKDNNLRYVCATREVAKLLNLSSPSEMLGKSDFELFGSPLADAFYRDDRHVLDTGESLIDNIDHLIDADGKDHYACTSKFPLKDSSGNVIGVYGIGRDITESRTIKSQFDLLTNSIPGGIATYTARDGALQLIDFNDGFCNLFGLSRAEYVEKSAENVFVGAFTEDIPQLQSKMDAFLQSNAEIDCVFRAHMPDGGYKWINMKASRIERDGDKSTFNTVLFDVTERQESLERIRISEEENRLAIQHTHNAVCRFDVATRVLRIPESAQADFSMPKTIENLPEGPIAAGRVSPETADAYRAFYNGILRGEATGADTYQRLTDKGWRWLEAHYSTIFSDAGEPISAVVSFTDVTEQLLKDSAYKKWRQSFQSKPPESYTMFRCNLTKGTSFDVREGELLTIRFAQGAFDFDEHTAEYAAQYVLEEDRERFSTFLNVASLLSDYYQGKRIATIEYREKLPESNFRWLRLTVDLVEHARSNDVEAYLLFEDIDKAKRFELATLEQAQNDPLTGVMNRIAFAAKVKSRIALARPNTQQALLMLDIDGFKLINDAFGHRAGDTVLVDVANALRTIQGKNDLLGRLGGDEFLLFISDFRSDSAVAAKAQQICAMTRKAFSAEVEISGSVGIAVTPRDGADFDTLYKKADAALYHVKGSGKDSYAFYQEEMADEHLVIENALSNAGTVETSSRKRRMLIVDDSRIDHALLTNIFLDSFIIEKAKDGNAALIRLRHYGAAISVVLLDLMMPGMDGFAVLEKMQESNELRNIPVIVVSSDEHRETGLRAIRAGAVDFVNKPVDPDILRIRVESAISKVENERLRAKNSFLEYQNSEVQRYKTALARSGIVVIEHDWVAGTFLYDSTIAEHIAGVYDNRNFWHILLSDFVAETQTVQKMQSLVMEIASDHTQSDRQLLVQLKTPDRTKHYFTMHAYKAINEFGLAGKIYMTFTDRGKERPEQA